MIALGIEMHAVVLLHRLDHRVAHLHVILDVQAVILIARHHTLQLRFALQGGLIDPHTLQADEVLPVRRQAQLRGHLALQRVDIADEVAHKGRGGVIVHLIGRTNLLDAALVEHRDAVGQGQGFLLVVGDINGGDAEIPLHLLQLIAQLHAELRVQVGQRLVHTDDGRPRHQRPGNSHALLLAAGQLADGLLQLLVGQVNLPGDLPHLLVDLLLFQLLDLQAEGNVVIHRHRGEQGIALEHNADVAILDGYVGNILAVHIHRALDRLNKAGDGAQRGGFAAARRAQEGEELPLPDLHVDAVQRLKVVKLDHNILQLNHGP